MEKIFEHAIIARQLSHRYSYQPPDDHWGFALAKPPVVSRLMRREALSQRAHTTLLESNGKLDAT